MADNDQPVISLDPSDFAEESDVKEQPVAEETTTASEPSSEEQEESTPAEPDEQEKEEPESEPAEEEKQSRADERKQQLAEEVNGANQEIRDLVSQRNELLNQRNTIRQEVEQLTATIYRPQTADEIMEETGQTPADARITAMEQREELRSYQNTVAEQQFVISSESQRVINDYPMFNPNSDNFQPAIATQAAQLLESNLIRDPNVPEYLNGQPTGKGIVVGAHVSPYQLYKTIADAQALGSTQGQVNGQRAAEQMSAAADPASSAPPKAPKEDPFLVGLTKGLKSSA
jgi:hypothetical protein